MSAAKSEIKMGTIAELGSKLDELHLRAEKEVTQCEGAKSALIEATKKIEQHMSYVDKDRDEGKLSNEEASMVKKYVQQCMGIVNNLATVAEVRLFQASGKMQSAESAIKLARGMFDLEKRKLDAYNAAQEDEEITGRLPGQRPEDPFADRRPALLTEEDGQKADTE